MKETMLNKTGVPKWAILLFTGLLLLGSVQAQGPPIFTDTPIMLGLEGRGLRTFGTYTSKENANIYLHPIAIPYNISAQWQAGVIAPFLNVSPDGMDSRFGMGDLKLFTKYQLIQQDGKGKTFRSLIKLTESFPTGNTKNSPNLGSGVFQTTIGLVNGYITTKYGIYGEIAYNFSPEGMPNNFLYNFAFAVPLLPQKYPPKQLNLFLEFNGNSLSTGNNILFISPGAQWIGGRRLLFETGIQLPLLEEVAEGQKTNYRFTFGTRILIF